MNISREAVEAAEGVWKIGNRHGPDADRKRDIAEYLSTLLDAKDAEIAALREALRKIASTSNIDGYEFMNLSREAMCKTARAALEMSGGAK